MHYTFVFQETGVETVTSSMADPLVSEAIAAIEAESATPAEKIEKLLKLALNLQKKSARQNRSAIELYLHAIEVCGNEHLFLRARAMTGLATALRNIPEGEPDLLLEARGLYEAALAILREHAEDTEIAATEMHLGLVLQSLVAFGKAQMSEAIRSYRRALRVFTGDAFPQEHAVLANNLAIAHLSMSQSQGSTESQQDVAVQIFEQALHWITPSSHPVEYAMLQNNLGNTLQYLFSNGLLENQYRAIAAYDEALKVRTATAMPLEYASLITHKAKILVGIPDDLHHPEQGNRNNRRQAAQHYQEAKTIFIQHGRAEQVRWVEQAIAELLVDWDLDGK